MTQITAQQVQELRRRTGAGMMACKSVLAQVDGNLDVAVEVLRKQGIAKAESRVDRATGEGLVASYVHHNGRIAALVEVACETDFVARSDVFQALAHHIAEHVAASAPVAVEWHEVPPLMIDEQRAKFERQARASGKPDALIETIVAGKLESFSREVVLLRQPWIRDGGKAIGELVLEASALLGEVVRVRRFSRFVVGGLIPPGPVE